MVRFKQITQDPYNSYFQQKYFVSKVTSFSVDALVLPDRSPYGLQIALFCSSQGQNSKLIIA
ncbi:hypothetical protein [Methanosarcina sp.]|uniref:hypothetical protein n=1 Tax=Methanosarcina sp. TaxID=2213 RepID=UPI0029880AE2|nr:hypothetical protein [Methanosarcina sp.]MDW5549883.1 hypothetical protein [Methanosarcina sp.]MDW5552487.1 hypothetical protein [Methanosarcina sp.]MDW5560217.1 hypothetical protein [Methanosarcina sp.]